MVGVGVIFIKSFVYGESLKAAFSQICKPWENSISEFRNLTHFLLCLLAGNFHHSRMRQYFLKIYV